MVSEVRARRVPVPPANTGDTGLADTASAITITVTITGAVSDRSPESWTRAMFEQAPRPLRWLLLIGWRAGLLLRLGPLNAPDRMLGWRITHTRQDRVDLEVTSPFLTARKIVHLGPETVTVSPYIRYRAWYAQAIWPGAAVLRASNRFLLTQAARAAGGGSQGQRPECAPIRQVDMAVGPFR